MKKLVFSALLLTVISAHAQTNNFVMPQISTLGAGLQIGSYRVNDSFSLRGNINGLKYDKTLHSSDTDYSARAHLFTAGLLADYYLKPNSGFHTTAGLYYNENYITGNGAYNKMVSINVGKKTIKINPSDYGSVGFKANYAKIAPYLGVGYHTAQSKGFSFSFDAGVLYQGNAKMSYDIPSGYQTLVSLKPSFNSAIEENKSYLQDKANKLKLYPVLSIGVSYKF